MCVCVQDELLTELIVRLKNGYPTTEREAKEFDERQEEMIKKFAAVSSSISLLPTTTAR